MAKNKLYKHHRSKSALIMRNFSLSLMGFIAVVAIAAIPTYISKNNVAEANASNEVEVNNIVTDDGVELLTVDVQPSL